MYAATLSTKLEQEWSDRHADRVFDFDGVGSYTGSDLLTMIRVCSNEDRDGVLYRLLELAHAGDKAAERVLVQVLIPAAKRHAHHVRVLDGDTYTDRVGVAVAAAWQVIRTYPMHRRAKVYPNLGMQLLGTLCPEQTVNERHVANNTYAVSAESLENLLGGWSPNPEPEVQLVRVFTWAVDHEVVTRDEVALMARAYLGELSMDELAEEIGIKCAALYKRVARTRARISAAWAAASAVAA